MTLADIPDGASVFLDANVLVYAFSQHPQFGSACRDLLERIERQELSGFISAHILGETAHRLMTLEACHAFGWPAAGIVRRLRQHPNAVGQLTRFQQAVDEILASRMQVLPTAGNLVSTAAALSRQTGLLTNDALLLAVMQSHGFTHLASHDADFDRVPGITRYGPA